MPKQFRLKIADPCHEDWDKMTTSEKGKFCGSCQKQVIDFTGMTDTQLAAFFKKPSTGSMCGRFFDDQLDRKITIPRKRIPWIKYFIQITIPLFLASCTGNRTKGKVAVETVQKESISKRTECTVTAGMISPPIFEEIQFDSTYVVGEIGIDDRELVGPPDSTQCSSKIVVSDKEENKLNNPAIDSSFTKAQFSFKEPEILSIDPKLLKSDEINCSLMNQELKGTVGGFIVRYNSDPEDEYDIEESEEAKIQSLEPGFKMYANPARANSTIFIDAKETEEGIYAIQLFNLSGQLIKQEQIRIGKGMGAITFSVPSVPAGNYLVVLFNKKTAKKATQKLIVQ